MKELLEIFKKITAIPHCSFKTERLKEFLKLECENAGAKVLEDKAGNILAKKGNPTICLQSHYDMVCVGYTTKIELLEDGGYIRAKNSSLGADNGIGVAMMLSLIKQKDNLELLFTNDEEVGLIGATNLNLPIKSIYLLNLDSEEEGSICLGCAGGVDLFATLKSSLVSYQKQNSYEINTKNFKGGHSGVDIDKNIKNAIKELAYFLKKYECKIHSINGGEAGNAIPKAVKAIVITDKKLSSTKFLEVKEIKSVDTILDKSDELLDLLLSFPSGVRSYDKSLNLVETSINLATIKTLDDSIKLEISPRAMSDIELEKLKLESKVHLQRFGFEVEFRHPYPAWKPTIGEFAKRVQKLSLKHFKNADFYAIHAGLECGVILKNSNLKEAVSIGPNIFSPHSIEERVEIESVKKVYEVVKELI